MLKFQRAFGFHFIAQNPLLEQSFSSYLIGKFVTQMEQTTILKFKTTSSWNSSFEFPLLHQCPNSPRRIAEPFLMDSHLIQHTEKQIAHRRVLAEIGVDSGLQFSAPATR